MNPIPIGLIIEPHILDGGTGALSTGGHCEGGGLFRHVGFDEHWAQGEDVDLGRVFELQGAGEGVDEGFCSRVGADVGGRVLGGEGRDVYDGRTFFAFQHGWDCVIGHQDTRDAVYGDLVKKSLIGDLVHIAHIRDTDIIDQYGQIIEYSFIFQLLEYNIEEHIPIASPKIRYNIVHFHIPPTFLLNLVNRLSHLVLISCYHTHIESNLSKLLTEAEADAVTAACDDGPGILAVSLQVIFLGQDHFYEDPEKFGDEDCEYDGTYDGQEVDEVKG